MPLPPVHCRWRIFADHIHPLLCLLAGQFGDFRLRAGDQFVDFSIEYLHMFDLCCRLDQRSLKLGKPVKVMYRKQLV